MMDVALILLLILLNGVFAMAEIAVVSSRKSRLQTLSDEGRPGAKAALALHAEPSAFLSTIQVGITTVAVLTGAIGQTTLAEPVASWLGGFPSLAPHAPAIASGLVVAAITYLSVVVGELVPKQFALLKPEAFAALVARPMTLLAGAARPLVWLLSASSGLLLRLLPGKPASGPPISDAEIQVLMEQGAEAGVFHESEQAMVANVLGLDQRPVGTIMTRRKDIYFLDLKDPPEENRRKVADSPHSRIPVCRGGLEHILGILPTSRHLQRCVKGESADLTEDLRPALYVPESASMTQLMESLRKARSPMALVVDEYGELQGLVTLTDLLTAIVGDLPAYEEAEADVVQREDGSWLVDGMLPIERLKELFDMRSLPGEDNGMYRTLGGFVTYSLGRIPAKADRFELAGWRFEVVDMDKNRVDEVLVSRLAEPAPVARE